MADRDEVSSRETRRILIFMGDIHSQCDGDQSDSMVRRSLCGRRVTPRWKTYI
jgi:hypothetical protein